MPSETRDDVLTKQAQYLFPAVISYYDEPLALQRGEGRHVWDYDGRRFLDFFGGILTVSLGHCRPEVTEAVRIGDSTTLDLMVPADFRYIEARRGNVIDTPRRTWLGLNAGLQSYEYEHVRAQQLDGTAVVMSIYTEKMEEFELTARYLITDVWMQDGGVWALVTRSQTEIGDPR